MIKNTIRILFLSILGGPLFLMGSPETDRKIDDAAKASYNYRMVLEDHVNVKTLDGVVTLTGTVQDVNDKALAQDTVENLPGVKSVNNKIVVKPTYPEHSDAWMAFKIRTHLLMKSNVSAISTSVDVKDGFVTLTGTAANQAQKELTAIYAREINWVKAVTNDIVVKDQAVTKAEMIDDASITSQVKYALRSNSATSALKVGVTTLDGRVTLTGQAGSDAGKSLVTKLAQDARGTKSVTNDMTVKI